MSFDAAIAFATGLGLPAYAPVLSAFGFVLGVVLIPVCANAILFWKYERLQEAWYGNLALFERRGLKLFYTDAERLLNELDYRSTGQVRLLEPQDKEGRELYSWAQRQARAAKAAALDTDQVDALRQARVLKPEEAVELLASAPDKTVLSGKYSFHPSLFARLGCGAFLMVGFCVASSMPNALSAVSACCIAFLMECIAITDLRVKLIPIELTVAFAAAALVFALAVGSAAEFAQGLVAAVCVLAVLLLANALSRVRSRRAGVGMGDLRLAPFIALISGIAGTLYGFAVASVLAFLFAVYVLLAKRGSRSSTVPYAPSLALWCYVGLFMRSALCM